MTFNELMGQLEDLKRQIEEADKLMTQLAQVSGRMANFDFSGLQKGLVAAGTESAVARATAGQLHSTRADFGRAFSRTSIELDVLADMVRGTISDLETLRYRRSFQPG